MSIMAISRPGYQSLELMAFQTSEGAVCACRSRPLHGFGLPYSRRKRDLGRVDASKCRVSLGLSHNNSWSCPSLGDLSQCGKSVLERRLLLRLGWQGPFGRQLRRSRRLGDGTMVTLNASKDVSISRGPKDDRRELKLDATDLMELEFGRLLGEDRQTTMKKVIGKKVKPDLSYIELERQAVQEQAERENRPLPAKQIKDTVPSAKKMIESSFPELVSPRRGAMGFKQVDMGEQNIPDLAAPPLRPKGAQEQNAKGAARVRVVPPVKFGGGKSSQSGDLTNYDGLIQKPSRARQSHNGLPPLLPVKEVIPPMLMRKRSDLEIENKQSRFIDGSLRKPALLSSNGNASSPPQDSIMASARLESLQVRDDVDLSAEKIGQSLEGKENLQQQGQISAPGKQGNFTGTDAHLAKSILPNLEKKPIVLGKPSLSTAQNSSVQEIVSGAQAGVNEIGFKQFLEEEKSVQLADNTPEPVNILASSTKDPPSRNPVQLNLEKKPTVLARPSIPGDEISTFQERYDVDSGVIKVEGLSATSSHFTYEPIPSVSEPSSKLKQRTRSNLERKPTVLVGPAAPVVPLYGTETGLNEAGKAGPPATVPSVDSVTKSAPEFFEPSSKVTNIKSLTISSEDTEDDNKGQLSANRGLLSQEADEHKASSSRPNVDQSAVAQEKPESRDSRWPVLNLRRAVSKPVMAAPRTDEVAESTTKYSETARSARPPSPSEAEQPDMDSNQGEETTSNAELSGRQVLPAKQLEGFRSVKERQKGSVDDLGKRVTRSEDAEGRLDRMVEAANCDRDPASQVEMIKKDIVTRRPSAVPSLRISPSIEVMTGPKPVQLNTLLESNLQKAIKVQANRIDTATKEEEDKDWARAEVLHGSKTVEEVTIIGSSRGGLLAAFGSLVGYLPASELTTEKRPPSFLAWAQSRKVAAISKGSTQDTPRDPDSTTEALVTVTPSDSAQKIGKMAKNFEQRKATNIAAEQELLQLYRVERAKYLSVLGSERLKIKVIVTSVDRQLRQLRFSQRQAEGEDWELAQKKTELMERLNVGDVVTCQVKNITPIGAFVELEAIPALIHISELSWTRNTDPSSVLQVGQKVEVKVCRLDHVLKRINLSLKQMKPDPLLETLDSLVPTDPTGSSSSKMSTVEELDTEAPANEALDAVLRKLAALPGISAVENGRRVRGAALAPGFQMYLSGPLDTGYKLLARFGNEVQEVLVETPIDREQMKDLIQQCMVVDT